MWRIVRRAIGTASNCPGGNCLGGNCAGGNYTGGNCPGAIFCGAIGMGVIVRGELSWELLVGGYGKLYFCETEIDFI